MVTFPDDLVSSSGQVIVNHVESVLASLVKRNITELTSNELYEGQVINETVKAGESNTHKIIIPPLAELHLIQLGNKLNPEEASIAKERFTRTATQIYKENVASSRCSSLARSSQSRCCDCHDSPTDFIRVDRMVSIMRKIMLEIIEDNITSSLFRSRQSKRSYVNKSIPESKGYLEVAVIPHTNQSSQKSMTTSTTMTHFPRPPSEALNKPMIMPSPSIISISSSSPSSSCSSSSISSSPIPFTTNKRYPINLKNNLPDNKFDLLFDYGRSTTSLNSLTKNQSFPTLDKSPSKLSIESGDITSSSNQSPKKDGQTFRLEVDIPCTVSKSTQCDFPDEEPKIVKILNKSKKMCSLISKKKTKDKFNLYCQNELGNDLHQRLNLVLQQNKLFDFHKRTEKEEVDEINCKIPIQRPDPNDETEASKDEPSVSIVNPFEDPDFDYDQINEEDDPYNLTFDFSLPSSEDASPHRFIVNSRYTVYTISGSLASSVNGQGKYSFKSLSTAHL